MPTHLLIAHAEEALMLAVVLSLPVVLASAIVSFLVSAFQAASQIQDTTLTHLPRFVVAVATLVVAGPWMGRELAAFASRIFSLAGH